jgi:2-polyprenyl-3-methyl-5-hydroxy-6-metoxy-1,4-benzoquinol methylase
VIDPERERDDGPHPADASYVIRTGADARDRLELIARLFWPTTELFLSRNDAFAAERFVDVGCGIGHVASRAAYAGVRHVLGIDVNPDVVAAAPEHGSSASFRVAGFTELGDSSLRDFDVVYARCVLSHQSDPHIALAAMLAATRPGGQLLVEDVQVSAPAPAP